MTFAELLATQDTEELEVLKILLKTIEPKNEFKGRKVKKLTEHKLGEVEELRQWYRDGELLYMFSKLTGVGHKEILRSSTSEALPFFRWIITELERIGKMESMLSKKSEEEMESSMEREEAGSHQMEKFGVLNEIDMLAKGDVTQWDKIMRMKYQVVFTKMLMVKTGNQIEMKLNKIRIERAKRKK